MQQAKKGLPLDAWADLPVSAAETENHPAASELPQPGKGQPQTYSRSATSIQNQFSQKN